MFYLYDVWVNWAVREERGFNVYSFHEWRNSDKIEILEQVPVLHITEKLFNYIEDGLHDLPEELLTKIHRKTHIRTGHKREILEYVCIVSDGRGILVIDTMGNKAPLKKSRLIPKQEQRILELISKEKRELFKYNSVNPTKKDLSKLSVEQVYGLTRRERALKQILLSAVYQLRHTNNKNELLYWLSEWMKSDERDIGILSLKQMWHRLYEGVKNGWSEKHELLCAQMVRGNDKLEGAFQLEQINNQNISK